MLTGIIAAMQSMIPARVELFHPLVVHFPVALLMTGTGLWMVALAFGVTGHQNMRHAATRGAAVLIALGVVAGLVAVKTGELAEDVVNQIICDPTITKDHEEWADKTLAFFTAGLAALIGSEFATKMRRFKRVVLPVKLMVTAILLAGVTCLAWTGHLGGRLVYEQGAAVKNAVHEPCPD